MARNVSITIRLLQWLANRYWFAGKANDGDMLVYSDESESFVPVAISFGADGSVSGIKGDKGDPGPAGPAGPTGPVGPTGPSGAQGPKGDPGSTGPTGATGPAGPTGSVGPSGPKGDPGLDGVDGQTGPPGLDGQDGATGPAGPAGAAGPAGPQGLPGDAGAAGATGPQGEPGVAGDVGPAGPQGPQGLPGADGATGPAGPTGATGPQGPKGDQGDPGATGSTGPQGPQGLPGSTGATGPKGDTGATGPAGSDGAPGSTGPQGQTGPQGLTGADGAQGPQGIQGPTGPAGPSVWGGISGTLSTQTDLQTALNGKAAATHTHAQSDVTGLGAALAAILGVYRTILQVIGSHTAARVAGTYGFGYGDPLAISGTGTLYPLAVIRIDSADYPTINGLAPKFRVKWSLEVNDVAPTGNFTFGLHPVTRPATSGGAGLDIYTIGAAVSGSTSVASAPAADAQLTGASADFALPADGYYVLGVVTTAAVATSSHLHLSSSLQVRNA